MYYFFGVLLIITGIVLKIYFSKSAFERRNQAGIEEFSSYWVMQLVRFLEKLTTLFIIAGVVLIFIGDTK